MLASERPEFEKHVGTLLAGFDRKITPERLEAYWLGCNRMSLGTFERAVARAVGEHGPDEVPTPKRMCFIAYELRAAGVSSSSTPQSKQPERDPLQRLAMSCLVEIVKRLGVPSHASGDAMAAAKNRIVAQLADSYGRRSLTDEEATQLRDVITPACEKHFKRRSDEELAADLEHFARTGIARGNPSPELQTSAAF